MRKLLLFLSVTFLISHVLIAQETPVKNVKKVLPNLLGSSNAGNEFWFSFPPCYEEVAGAENTTRVFVASGVRQPVTVEVPGKGFSVTKMAVANDVVEFKLPSAIGQAYSKPTQGKAPPERKYGKCGVHVTALAPIVVYGMTRFQYTSDGFLAVPVSGLGNDYVVASWPQYTAAGSGYKLPGLSNIVAAYDDTEVTFIMGGPLGSKTTGGLKIGQSSKWNLDAGDVICFANDDDGQDIAGSRVVSNKPVGVISGNQCANVPAGVPWCDFTVEMELPTNTWGKEYHVTPVVERLYNPVIRIFAHPDYKNIKVYRDGQDWLVLPNNNRSENQAFVERRVYDGPPRSTIISANAPIYIMLYNTGQADDNVSSDPFQYVLTPIEQYQKEIVFATPNAKGGTLPFTRNFVNIVYAVGDGNVVPQDLEFATVNNGQFEWRTVASRFGAGPGQLFALKSSNGEQYAMKRIQLPGDGVFRIRAKKPFAAYAYGFSDYDSYGFPTSVALGDLSKKDPDAPNPEYKVLCDGSVVGPDGKSPIVTDLPNDAKVRSNLAIIYMDQDPDSSYNYDFKFDKIIAGQTVRTNWTLKVIDPAKDARAKLFFIDKAGNDTSIIVEYKAFQVTLLENPTDFGAVKAGQTYTKTFKAINNSDFEATVKRLELKSGKEGFTITETDGKTITLPFSLKGREEKIFNVTFVSDKTGPYEDKIGIGDDCVFGYPVDVRAVVGEPIILVESDAIFGQMTVGSNDERDFTVKNIGTAPLVVDGYTMPSNPEFEIYYNGTKLTGTNLINKTTPLILQPQEFKPFKVRFTANAEKKYDDRIEFLSDAGKNIDNEELMSGEGIKPGLLAIGYDWKRRRINKDYVETAGITLKNTGSQAITVIDATASNATFKYDKSQLLTTLQPQESKLIQVTFNPATIADKDLTVQFTTNDPTIKPEAILLGVGIIGKLKTQDVDFGQTKLDNGTRVPSEAVVKKVRFEYEDYQYSDEVTIQLPFSTNGNGIKETLISSLDYGTQGFLYDLSTLTTNGTYDQTAGTVLLTKVGDYVEFDAAFNGETEGSFSSQLTSNSDADQEVTSTLTGRTINVPSGRGILDIEPDADVTVCVNSNEIERVLKVRNIGDADLTIASVTYDKTLPTAEWSIVDDKGGSFTLAKGTEESLRFKYTPSTIVGSYPLTITVTPSNGDTPLSRTLTGTTVSYTDQVVVEQLDALKGYGQTVNYAAKLSVKENLPLVETKTITLTIKYPAEMFVYQKDMVIASNNTNLQIEPSYPTDDNKGTIVVKLSSKSGGFIPVIKGGMDLVKFSFYSVLPSTYSFTGGKVEISASANDCYTLTGNSLSVTPFVTCFKRIVNSSGNSSGIVSISPNPISGSVGEVNFSVGLKTTTTLTVFDALGKEVMSMPMGLLEPGEYTVNVPTESLGSGNYTVKMVSGPYTHIGTMIIAK